jgi:ABC-type branched-subunit amino acid transport system substrate-binding protein
MSQSSATTRPWTRFNGAACVALVTLTIGCTASSHEPSDTWNIGLLLPYTGASSGVAANFERAAIYAVDRINAGGGIKDKKVRLVAADTHSDVSRALEGLDKLIEEKVVIVIGPESSDIATAIAPVLQSHQIAFLSPLIGAANDKAYDCSHRWFRLAPSSRALGEALAKQLVADNVPTTTILNAAGSYNEALRDAVASRFRTLKGTVIDSIELDPNAQSYDEVVEKVVASNVESVVLATAPKTAALIINEFDAATKAPPRWYLSPLLKTDVLVENVAPEALDGAIGVAPDIYNTSADFPNAFAERWNGDHPLEGAYFYYDALALIAFSLQMAKLNENGVLELPAFESAILDAAAAPGESAQWSQIEIGLERLRNGDNMFYSGLTGPMVLENCGTRRKGTTSVWQVTDGVIGVLEQN